MTERQIAIVLLLQRREPEDGRRAHKWLIGGDRERAAAYIRERIRAFVSEAEAVAVGRAEA